ncbi:hypothetical protein [Actinomadura rudentiformis]|uniref:Uncharacterized protein n=1 Tax=Actinomadura rudentiformis TaxID=359158 RepID=A0A6H9YGC8_9ACTN|nr:hypothetical protein [Actinomadura rudentiformis]KAB2344754.1 hypothetical protein F8566_29550 [Actinomadura rudentiformis]
MQEALLALWQLTPVRLAARLGNIGLNTITAQELLDALVHTELIAALVAIAWLIPWERIALATYRSLRRRQASMSTTGARTSLRRVLKITNRASSSDPHSDYHRTAHARLTLSSSALAAISRLALRTPDLRACKRRAGQGRVIKRA